MVKKAFSLAEAVVVMAVISILFALSAKILTATPKVEKENVAHGYFECFKPDIHRNGNLTSYYMKNGNEIDKKDNQTSCQFDPPTDASGFSIYALNPYFFTFEPTLSSMKIEYLRNTDSNIWYINNKILTTNNQNETRDEARAVIQLYPNSRGVDTHCDEDRNCASLIIAW